MSDCVLRYRFMDTDGRLSDNEAVFWKTYLFRSMKIGIELEVMEPPDSSREEVLKALRKQLRPSKSTHRFGDLGVLTVTRELQGLEVKIVGRNPVFDHFLGHLSNVFKILMDSSCRPSGACGMHYHLIAPPLAQDLPALILTNLWSLTRWYAAPLRWLTSCGAHQDCLTRRRLYCDHEGLKKLDPQLLTIHTIKEELEGGNLIRAHNSFLNIEHIFFRGSSHLSTFHIEFRFPDMDMVAFSVAVKGYLFFALVIRAIELAKYGLLILENDALRERMDILDRLSNNDGAELMSDTSGLTDGDLKWLQRSAQRMVQELRSALTYFEPTISSILEFLAKSPISQLRSMGNDWQEIEYIYQNIFNAEDQRSHLGQRLIQLVELGEIMGVGSEEEWIALSAKKLDVSSAYMHNLLNNLGFSRSVHWDSTLGTMTFHYR